MKNLRHFFGATLLTVLVTTCVFADGQMGTGGGTTPPPPTTPSSTNSTSTTSLGTLTTIGLNVLINILVP